MSDLQKQEIYDQLYEGYRVYKSDSLSFARYANRNQSERFKSTRSSAPEPPPSWELYEEATFKKNPGNLSPELKGSYYVMVIAIYVRLCYLRL
jgi:hypothetical protein